MDATTCALLQAVETEKTAWKSSACRQNLLSFLAKAAPKGGWSIHRAAMMALGCIDGDIRQQGQRNMDGREVKQLAVFLDLVEYLQAFNEKRIRLYAQDPIFKLTDIAVLTALNFTILAPPQAEGLAGKTSFHFAAMYDRDEEVLASKPTLFVGRQYEWVVDQARGRAEGRSNPATEEDRKRCQAIEETEQEYDRMEICEGDCEHRVELKEKGEEGRIPVAHLWVWCKRD